MSVTIGDVVLLFIILLMGLFISFWIYVSGDDYNNKNIKHALIHQAINIIIVIAILFGMNWYNTSTASGIRKYKDFKSEMSNGMYRELIITAEDGREIFRYEGKFDIERHEEGDDRYLRFESEDGKRYTISYGIQDTMIVIEKDNPETSN